MAETCTGDVFFRTSKSVPEIGGTFPNTIEVYTEGAIHFVRAKGVYVLNKGDYRDVRVKGICPNSGRGCGLCPANVE